MASGAVAATLLVLEPVFIVVTKWFTVRRGAALTVVTLIGAWSSIVFSPLTEHLAATDGRRGAVQRLAVVLVAVTIPLHLLVRNAPRCTTRPLVTLSRRALVAMSAWWLLAGALAANAFATAAIGVHLVSLLAVGRAESGARPPTGPWRPTGW
jgi:hypothetical protein